MRKTFGIQSKSNISIETPQTSFPYEIIINIEKYELENVIETSAAFLQISFKMGNRKIEGIEKPNIIKKIAKFKNETFKLESNFIEFSKKKTYDFSSQIIYKEKKGEFLIHICSSSSKSSKIETLSTIIFAFDLSTYLNEQILGKDETLEIKNSKYAGFLSFNIAFQAKFSILGISADMTSSNKPSKDLKRSKSITIFPEETKTSNDFKFVPSSEKIKPKIMRKLTAPTRSTMPKIIVKGPPLDNAIQKFISKSPDEFEKKINHLLGSGLQTIEETEFLNRKLEIMALKEENLDFKHENEKLKEEKTAILKALADLNEEKQNWFKCFQSQTMDKSQVNIKNEENIIHSQNNLTLEMLEKLRIFEEKFMNQEEKSKENTLNYQNKVILDENKALHERLIHQDAELLTIKNELSKKEELVQEYLKKSQTLEKKYISSKEDIGHIVNIILTNGNAEIMDLIEPYLKSGL